ncbi:MULTISPECIES: PaaI family thioesterase [unclassified Ruegeria]|uniref:PaaI family thioesterase n=1 Tax=unclassified Ruegeria TaxID=2625375 RepID=UPI00148898FA|nr:MULTISPECIES: PaaI family thioesterase [unclassified Ruegeria]NOD75457.1 hotdog fold thioesterase [Ruegeria sp. HKCCD4332]NOD87439.1 hotdog fold thioesterase [Ruegeria sp. HKCCD4318]NOD91537.1 hotdog fold thioesterase [Ruegeria sp. HKCCD4884]NOE12994.1 hotdog fold thioesterase [Ruegeria sp. HKCCD4318-2]NOG08839.1 PaaI family thioesterase [Ruegeria sp. HKCCD4315]
MALAMNRDELSQYLKEVFPQVHKDFVVEELAEENITMRLVVQDRHLRPGGTVSGPSMFGLADVSVYAMILARVGRQSLAVTTNSSLDFLRKPTGGADLIATCRLLKLGRTLAVGDVLIFSEGMDKPVARAAMTYSIPPAGSAAARFG